MEGIMPKLDGQERYEAKVLGAVEAFYSVCVKEYDLLDEADPDYEHYLAVSAKMFLENIINFKQELEDSNDGGGKYSHKRLIPMPPVSKITY